MKISKRKIKSYILLAVEIIAVAAIVVFMFKFALSMTRATVPEEVSSTSEEQTEADSNIS